MYLQSRGRADASQWGSAERLSANVGTLLATGIATLVVVAAISIS